MKVRDRIWQVGKPLSDVAFLPWRIVWTISNRANWSRTAAVGTSPHLPTNSLQRWRELLAQTNVYLEYGSGGSTIEAARSASVLVSVDTDSRYLAVVERQVKARSPGASFYPIFVDIGWTQKWGRPLIRMRTKSRLAKWRSYTSAPWVLLDKLECIPDFIFIDGRFRAASALECMLRLPAGARCTFMLDDFDRRKAEYGDILQFADDIEFVDRSVLFRKAQMFDSAKCASLLRVFQADPE